jgi:ABC-type transport system involved in multi-copper enzyme maturation permease subunit
MPETMKKIRIIARFTLLEALRTRLPWMALAVLVLLFLASLFVQHISIAEASRMQTGFLAAASRLAMVFMLSLHIASSVVREFNDKGVDLLLSMDLPRSGYYLGRLLGFSAIACLLALVTALVILAVLPEPQVLVWGLSLALELVLVSALTLFCVLTFAQIMPAISFVIAFYLLARSIRSVQLLSESPLIPPESWSSQAVGWLVDALSWLLPDLGQFTSTAWIVDHTLDGMALLWVGAQALLYSTLLVLAGLFDLYRKNL